MKIVIHIHEYDIKRRKEIMNSIKGFVRSLAKRFRFEMEFNVRE